MDYKPLRDILSDLDAQQRRELAALGGRVEAAELHRARNVRKRLFAASVFFIERSWEMLAPQIETFSLEVESGKSGEELRAYLQTLGSRQPAFAWGWTRARMDAALMRWLEACVPGLLLQYPEEAADYADCLRQADYYRFRQTPLHHLKAGYHTALGAACKWYGAACELQQSSPLSCPSTLRSVRPELRMLASFSLTMLVRADGYLWDSAGAEPLQAVLSDGSLNIALQTLPELALDTAPDYGLRLGCPALRARCETGLPAFDGIIAWVEQVFSQYLLEPSPLVSISRAENDWRRQLSNHRGQT